MTNISTIVAIKAVPRASCDEIVGWQGGVLKVRVTAPPQDGRANDAIEALLAAGLGLKRRAVHIVSGRASSHKRVAIEGLGLEEIERRLRVA